MSDTSKLLQLLTDIDTIEDIVKVAHVDGKLDNQTANEILRMIKDAKTRALK